VGVRELIIQPGSKCIRETVPAGGTQDQILSARELEKSGTQLLQEWYRNQFYS
jgi:hypothetical protein